MDNKNLRDLKFTWDTSHGLGQIVKEPSANAFPSDIAKLNNLPSNGTPLQYSCLENPMDGGAW